MTTKNANTSSEAPGISMTEIYMEFLDNMRERFDGNVGQLTDNNVLTVRHNPVSRNNTFCRRSGSCFRRSFCRYVRTTAVKTQIASKHGGNRHTADHTVQPVVVASRYQFPHIHAPSVTVGDRRRLAG